MKRVGLLLLLLFLIPLTGSLAFQALLAFEVIEGSEWEENVLKDLLVSAFGLPVFSHIRDMLPKEDSLSYLVSILPAEHPPPLSAAF